MACGCAKKNPTRWRPIGTAKEATEPPGPSHRIVTSAERQREVVAGSPPRARQPRA